MPILYSPRAPLGDGQPFSDVILLLARDWVLLRWKQLSNCFQVFKHELGIIVLARVREKTGLGEHTVPNVPRLQMLLLLQEYRGTVSSMHRKKWLERVCRVYCGETEQQPGCHLLSWSSGAYTRILVIWQKQQKHKMVVSLAKKCTDTFAWKLISKFRIKAHLEFRILKNLTCSACF